MKSYKYKYLLVKQLVVLNKTDFLEGYMKKTSVTQVCVNVTTKNPKKKKFNYH